MDVRTVVELRKEAIEAETKAEQLLDHVKELIDAATTDPQKNQPPDPATVSMLLQRAQVFATLALSKRTAMAVEVLGSVTVHGRR